MGEKALLTGRFFYWRDLETARARGARGRKSLKSDGGRWEAFGRGGEGDVAGWGCGAEDCDGVAFVELAVFSGVGA